LNPAIGPYVSGTDSAWKPLRQRFRIRILSVAGRFVRLCKPRFVVNDGNRPLRLCLYSFGHSHTAGLSDGLRASSVSFAVDASGTGPLAYQWLKDGNACQAPRRHPCPSLRAAIRCGSYACVVGNMGGNVTSSVATLTVNAPPVITVQPVAQTVCVGSSASFSVTATGSGSLAYQWTKDGANIWALQPNIFPLRCEDRSGRCLRVRCVKHLWSGGFKRRIADGEYRPVNHRPTGIAKRRDWKRGYLLRLRGRFGPPRLSMEEE